MRGCTGLRMTSDFLSHFNLETLKDLPGLDELKAAGMLDARPVMSSLPRESDDEVAVEMPDEDSEFSVWVSDEPETELELDAAAAE